jgi:actin-like ATPase involved in cell morphogenesis
MIGLDIGTSNIVCASKDPGNPQSEVQINSVRDIFLDIESDPTVLNMLKMGNVSYLQDKEYIYIIGEAALNFANMFKKDVRRPLSKGLISAGELEAEKILSILVKSVLKEPRVENEVVYYSVPAAPINDTSDVVYHEQIFKKIIENMKFRAVPMNEASAIVYSNCQEQGFTALSTSFGAGLVNTALLFKTVVGLAFSVNNSGDWIDSSAAKATGTTSTKIMSIKEKGVDLLDPSTGDPKNIREREAIIVYYKNLIRNTINEIKKELKKNNSKIELPEDVVWVLSGGTAKAGNFLELFKQEFDKVKDTFPLGISEIKLSKDLLNDVAKGLLVAAMND